MKPDRMSQEIRQTQPKIPGDLSPKLDQNLIDEFTIDEIEDMLQVNRERCYHTPDMLEPIDFEDHGDTIIRISKCHCCGEIIKEVFTSSG